MPRNGGGTFLVIVTEEMKREIRSDLRSVLKTIPREDLIRIWAGKSAWCSIEKEKIAYAHLTDKQLIRMILDRDVADIVRTRERQGW